MKPFIPFLLLATGVYSAPQVKLSKTTLIRRDIPSLKQDFFGGIPYAKPPLSNLRFKPPVLKNHLDSATFDASNFGHACLQLDVPTNSISEDCLTINVFRPSNVKRGTKLPVLFWTYGGSFQGGSASLYNGSLIVNRSIERGTPLIYVNFNYRVGALGFPPGQEANEQKALNLGVKDTIAALEWVQHNIGAFGGDKNKVIASGESAGAMMTSILYINFPLHQLARGAISIILESGSAAFENLPAASRQDIWKLFVEGVPSCTDKASSSNTFDCLRQANSTEMLSGLSNALQKSPTLFAFQPNIDGPGGVYQDLPSRVLDKGTCFPRCHSYLELIKMKKATFVVPGPTTLTSEQQIHNYLITNFSPPLVPHIELYPDNPALGSQFNTGNDTFGFPSSFKRAAALFCDIWFTSQRRFWQQKAAKAGTKTWGYLFTQPQPSSPPFLGTTHATEIDYVYGRSLDTSPSGERVSTVMMDYWISFTTSLDPNDGKGMERPVWEQYTPWNEHVIQLDGNDLKMIDDTFRKEQMDYINSNPAVFLH